MGAIIKTIATKDDIANLKDVKCKLADLRYALEELRQDIRKAGTDIIWGMFFFWITQVAATFIIFYLFLRK